MSYVVLLYLFSMDSDSQLRGKGQNKHYWTQDKDKALIDALLEISTNPLWWAENGFHNGCLVQIKRTIKEKLPQSTLKASSNIESTVKLLKKKTTAIVDILQISGFVWNYEMYTIECGKSAFDEYVKVCLTILIYKIILSMCYWNY